MTTAPSLPELEHAFADAVLTGEAGPLLPWIEGHGLASQARLQIYRNIVYNNLTAALRTAYPAVLKLAGEAFFDGAAARYIQAYPSRGGNLQEYGSEFSQFLAGLSEASVVPYLAEVARLEWGRQEAYLAADGIPIDLTALTALPEEELESVGLPLHPSVRLLSSEFPVLDIWLFCQGPASERLRLTGAGQHALVWRDRDKIAMQELDPARYLWVAALRRGTSLGASVREVTERYPDFHLTGGLRWLFNSGLVIGVAPSDPATPSRNQT